jgi:hypothetical protein
MGIRGKTSYLYSHARDPVVLWNIFFVANMMEVETSLLLHKSRRLEWVNTGEYLNKSYSSAVYYSEETAVTALLSLLQ